VPDVLAATALERFSLANGLRVVVSPDHSAPVVALAVVYDVGFRSEPEGRSGFAHLFEHLMFQGSANVEKMEHGRLVQGAGGVMNGHTRPDLTSYYEALPKDALALALWLEADRMAGLRLDQENLDNQIAVVKEEIRVNVANQPYGGFPWIDLPALAFDTYPNAHNGYGSFDDLDKATCEDAAEFFTTYYAPANAALVIVGDVDVDDARGLVETHFGDLPARPRPERPSFAEPPLAAVRRATKPDPLAPTPAIAIGRRAPDPVSDLTGLLAAAIVGSLLTDGDASRLRRRLVHEERVATDVGCLVGTFGDPLSMRSPLLFQTLVFHPGRRTTDQLVAAVDEEIARLAADGPTDDELGRVRAALAAARWRQSDPVLERALAIADAEIIHARPSLPAEIAGLIETIDRDAVRTAAADLLGQAPAILETGPGLPESRAAREGGAR